MQKLCVIGSLNIDLTIRTPHFPLPGESIIGTDFATYTGGKGGNQAIAAARLGGDLLLVARLGADQYESMYRTTLDENGVDTSGLLIDPQSSSGVALIVVDTTGENSIVLAPGANMRFDRSQIDACWPMIAQRDIFLFQLEIPMDTILYAAARLHAAGKTVILDPAPAQPLPDPLFSCVDYLTPNETELALLTGLPTETDAQAVTAAQSLLKKGVQCVIAKRGTKGAMLVTQDRHAAISGFAVNAVDTTAAGDSFNAGFAVALAQDKPLAEAVRFANAVGALSTTAAGAQAAMPTMSQAMALLAQGSAAQADPR